MFLAVELRGAVAGLDVIKMFQRAGVARAAGIFIERNRQLREARTVHHGRNVDDDHGIFPAGQHARHEAVGRDECVVAFDDGARGTSFFHHIIFAV